MDASRSVILAMLRDEEEMRKSSSVQRLLDARREDRGEAIFLALQKEVGFILWMVSLNMMMRTQVARRAGFDDVVAGVCVLRSAKALFPTDEDVTNAAMYLRHNRSREGTLQIHDPAPDIDLASFTLGGEPVIAPLSEHIQLINPTPLPTILIAGSVT